MAPPKIRSYIQIRPMIYAYNTPGVIYHEGWTKIGYTERQTVEERIRQQTRTAGIRASLAWKDEAVYRDGSGEYFTDRAFHTYLTSSAGVKRERGTEWFQVDGPASRGHFERFVRRETVWPEKLTYTLREEQERAAAMTHEYFQNGGTDFLWNAKPRFGKTLTSYDLICRMGLEKVLIVSNRPSISNSWAEDFAKFIGWRGKYSFVSDNEALKGRRGVMSRDEYVSAARRGEEKGMIAFESLQGLKGSVYMGGGYDKLKWIRDLEFDLLIVDESHEGVDTLRTERAFRNIRRKHTLYLSGTPFRALANDQFTREQIFNWSYADEQEAKENWSGEEANPYEELPKLVMYTYQLSQMIREQLERGLDLTDEGDTVDYAFDLNEFFATDEGGRFLHEEEVKKFLSALSSQEKYPFSTPELRAELAHTMWYLNRVASAQALKGLLENDPVFGAYHVVLAAGSGAGDDDEEEAKRSYDRVKAAIERYDKTITLTVGQLTVGVTIPEWSGVLMLCNMKSASSYIQAAFRAQNPSAITRDGQRLRKDSAYLFDFDPARTLIVYDEFANNLSADMAGGRGSADDRKVNIGRLLNFFPVLAEDEEGRMEELDVDAVLSIPRRLKSQEVVRRGFMSNFLFQNISNVFGAPAAVREIVEKLVPAHEEGKRRPDPERLSRLDTVPVDEDGEVEVPAEIVIGEAQGLFGPKVYERIVQTVNERIGTAAEETGNLLGGGGLGEAAAQALKENIRELIIEPAVKAYDARTGVKNQLERQIGRELDQTFQTVQDDFEEKRRIAEAEFAKKRAEAASERELEQARAELEDQMTEAERALMETIRENVEKTVAETSQEVVEKLERHKAEQEKKSMEEEVRARLRGFSRTIPSFIMAYGDQGLTLENLDRCVEEDVFLEVTGITVEDFRFLRDGGERIDPETGETAAFKGRLFDEIVFNDAVCEFWKKKQELANYFDEDSEEDIFDYIPPQKTNQIFTPKWVVSMMADQLEQNTPGCFDDPGKKFADLYMKSGLYITEIVKRLYRSEGLKAAYPDGGERIRHILQEQVYGMAPTRIIYLIATNYILGFDESLRKETHNFVEADAAEAAKQGKLERLVNEYFGRG